MKRFIKMLKAYFNGADIEKIIYDRNYWKQRCERLERGKNV